MTRYSLLLIALTAGCALTSARARVQLDEARLAHARDIDAKRRAPVPYEQFEAALRAAQASSDKDGSRAVRTSEAHMWLEVAIADGERLLLAEQRLEEERALVAIDAEIIALERNQRALADQNAAAAAQALARDEAKRALARAARKTAQRVKLSREDAQRAALALRRQAEVIGLTLHSLGRPDAELARLRAKLAEVDALLSKDPEASLSRADEALYLAQAALAALRTGDEAPSALEKAALAEALTASGATIGAFEHGRTATVEGAFRAQAPTPSAARILTRLCVLARAYPHGPVQLAVDGTAGPQVDARIRVVQKHLTDQDCKGTRYTIVPSGREGELVEVRWLAY